MSILLKSKLNSPSAASATAAVQHETSQKNIEYSDINNLNPESLDNQAFQLKSLKSESESFLEALSMTKVIPAQSDDKSTIDQAEANLTEVAIMVALLTNKNEAHEADPTDWASSVNIGIEKPATLEAEVTIPANSDHKSMFVPVIPQASSLMPVDSLERNITKNTGIEIQNALEPLQKNIQLNDNTQHSEENSEIQNLISQPTSQKTPETNETFDFASPHKKQGDNTVTPKIITSSPNETETQINLARPNGNDEAFEFASTNQAHNGKTIATKTITSAHNETETELNSVRPNGNDEALDLASPNQAHTGKTVATKAITSSPSETKTQLNLVRTTGNSKNIQSEEIELSLSVQRKSTYFINNNLYNSNTSTISTVESDPLQSTALLSGLTAILSDEEATLSIPTRDTLTLSNELERPAKAQALIQQDISQEEPPIFLDKKTNVTTVHFSNDMQKVTQEVSTPFAALPSVSLETVKTIQPISFAQSVATTHSAVQTVAQTLVQAQETQSGITVRLNPPEMGRVYIDFQFNADRTVTAIVQSEVPETASILKHNAEVLQNVLKDSGFSSVTLSFEQNNHSEHKGFDSDQNQKTTTFYETEKSEDPPQDTVSSPVHSYRISPESAIDLKL